jgi:hypothetical protein
MLSNSDPVVEIVNYGWIDFSVFEPPIGCICSKDDRIFIRKACLPTAKRLRVIAFEWNICFAQSTHKVSSPLDDAVKFFT